MNSTPPQFDTAKPKTVYAGQQSELYELAEDALFNGDGTFTYDDQLWQVFDGKPGQYLDVWPALLG